MLNPLIVALGLNTALAAEATTLTPPTEEPAPAPAPAPAPKFSEMYGRKAPAGFDGVRHGFRAGYVYANRAEDSGLFSSPHLFSIGYEGEVVIASGEGIDFMMVPNITLLGLNQGVLLPSANGLIGLSFYDTIKVGVGANITPVGYSWVNMVAAVAFVPTVGKLQLPMALSYVPSETDHFRVGLSLGVNWPKPA